MPMDDETCYVSALHSLKVHQVLLDMNGKMEGTDNMELVLPKHVNMMYRKSKVYSS